MNEEQRKKVTGIMERVFNSDEGVAILHYLYHDLCGYDSPSLSGDFDEGRRLVYVHLRRCMSPELKRLVEIDYKIETPEAQYNEELSEYIKKRFNPKVEK